MSLNIGIFLDTLENKYNTKLDYALIQGSTTYTLNFFIGESGIPIQYVSLPTEVSCYVVNYDRLDFRKTILETSVKPTIAIADTIVNGQNTYYTIKIVVDTNLIKEVLNKPYKTSIIFKINGMFTTQYDFNVIENPAYILNNII